MTCARAAVLLLLATLAPAQEDSEGAGGEARHYSVDFLETPPGEVIEVGDMDFLPDGSLVLGTRRGRVWVVERPAAPDPAAPRFRMLADGLHEALGIQVVGDVVHVLQRGEISRLRDEDGDGFAEVVETVSTDWGMTGNYHEFAFGLPRDRKGRFYLALNLGFWMPQWWHGRSRAPWRGWLLRVRPDGRSEPVATGLRSPNGLELSPGGDLFVTDNQGDWMPVCPIFHVKEGGFYGHPAGLAWTDRYRSEGLTPHDREPPHWKREPAVVWMPYSLSRSAAGMAWDRTGGRFGPFEGQLFVAELTRGLLARVMLEKVRGVWQGACMRFREDVGCANRVAFGPGGTLYVGLTERGWGGKGRPYGIARVRYTGEEPFEVSGVHLLQDGFELRFTEPLGRPLQAEQLRAREYDYNWWWKYGSPVTNRRDLEVAATSTSDDGETAVVRIPDLRAGMVVKLVLDGVESAAGAPLLHQRLDYTINQLPAGPWCTKHVANRVPPPPSRESRKEGWLAVSNGHHPDDWTGDGWRAANISWKKKQPGLLELRDGAGTYASRPGAAPCAFTSRFLHGDVEAELQVLLPEGGKGGVAFMGRYEILLCDEQAGANGATLRSGTIPLGGGRDLLLPAKEAAEEAGSWQKLEVVFRAPRFAAGGERLKPACFERVVLNGKELHKEVELPGVTAGLPARREFPRGPLTLLCHEGQVAYRGVRIRSADWDAAGGSGWTALFDHATLEGWQAVGWSSWTVEDGVVAGSGRPGFLLARRPESPEVSLRARVKVTPGCRGAVCVGADGGLRDPGGYQLLLDPDDRADPGPGSVLGHARTTSIGIPPNVWCEVLVTCCTHPAGLKVEAWLNGMRTASFVDPGVSRPGPWVGVRRLGGKGRLLLQDLEVRSSDES